jgi:hypothetical protein
LHQYNKHRILATNIIPLGTKFISMTANFSMPSFSDILIPTSPDSEWSGPGYEAKSEYPLVVTASSPEN